MDSGKKAMTPLKPSLSWTAIQHQVSYLGWEYTRPYASTLRHVFAAEAQNSPAP